MARHSWIAGIVMLAVVCAGGCGEKGPDGRMYEASCALYCDGAEMMPMTVLGSVCEEPDMDVGLAALESKVGCISTAIEECKRPLCMCSTIDCDCRVVRTPATCDLE